MNAIVFEERRGRGQESATYSLRYAEPFSSFTDDKMILQAITVHDTFIIILSQYIVFINACYTLYDAHLVARILRYS